MRFRTMPSISSTMSGRARGSPPARQTSITFARPSSSRKLSQTWVGRSSYATPSLFM